MSTQLHGFCDASENAYAGVVYLRMTDAVGQVHLSLVTSKTRVAPLKRLTIPRLELCGALLLSQIVTHVQRVLDLPSCCIHAWMDSTVVLDWLSGDPRRFKTYVGNRVTQIVELVSPSKWNHVSGLDNPADCASRGLFPSELLRHHLWWNGPDWLSQDPSHWPQTLSPHISDTPEEEREICFVSSTKSSDLIDMGRYSNYTRLKCMVAWMFRFTNNCTPGRPRQSGPLSTAELNAAETYLLSQAQTHDFPTEAHSLEKGKSLPKGNRLQPLHPFIDQSGLIRVGGRLHNSHFSYSQRHPIILHGRHPLTRLIVQAEHTYLLHAGPTSASSSLGRRFHIIRQRTVVRDITRACVTCRRTTAKPQAQLMGQLPLERVTPGTVFECVGVDYAGPVQLKLGLTRKPKLVKAYIGVFVSLSVKAVHLELISDLTSAAFIACLRRFIARRGKPSTIWSDHGSNFVGAA